MAAMRTSSLSSDQLCRLLAMGLGTPKRTDAEVNASALLRRWLAREAPPGARRTGAATAPLTSDRTIGDLLVDSASDISDIISLKNLAKAWVRQSRPGREREVAATIYYAATAVALVRHGRRITRLSLQGLGESFVDLAGKHWMTRPLRKLFEMAQAAVELRG